MDWIMDYFNECMFQSSLGNQFHTGHYALIIFNALLWFANSKTKFKCCCVCCNSMLTMTKVDLHKTLTTTQRAMTTTFEKSTGDRDEETGIMQFIEQQ